MRRLRLLAVLALVATALPTHPAAAAADDTFRNGKATATAQVVRIGPGVGNLELATALGTTASKVENRLAQAQSQALDLGLIGTTLTAQACDGSPGPVTPDQLPQPLVADNTKGAANATKDETPVAGATLGVGRKTVNVDTTPSSDAVVSAIAAQLDPLVSISGGRAESISKIVNHNAREADGLASVDLDIAGVVHLHNLQWRAVHRTGASPSVTGAFSVADGTIGNVAAPIDQLGALQKAINDALVETGITVDLPHVEHVTKPNDIVFVTPLVLQIKNSPLGHTAFGPGLNASREQRELLFNTVAKQYCQLAGALLVADIATDIVSGTGFLTIELGGVSATSADIPDFNPFGSNDAIAPVIGALPPIVTNLPLPSLAAAGVEPPTAPMGVEAASITATHNVCESVASSRRVGCSHGAALPVGLIGIVLTAAVGLWDRRRRLAAEHAVA